MKRVTSEVWAIQLSRLRLAPENVRKTETDPAADAELIASIRELGLKQNLIVRKSDDGETNMVVGGGRRLRALEALAEAGEIDPEEPIPCVLVDESEALATSIAENIVRSGMEPADEIEAFTALAGEGMSVAEIALRFGYSEGHVQRYLRLGGAAPELIEALREGVINLPTLKAFVLTDDHDLQRKVLGDVRGTWKADPRHVRPMVAGGSAKGTSKLARYVGLEDYLDAGGAVTRDLFADPERGDGIYLDDIPLLETLARRKLEAAAEALPGPWKWVEVAFDFGYQELGRYRECKPKGGHSTDEEKARLSEISDELHRLRGTGYGDRWDELIAEQATLRETAESRADFTPYQRKIAGVMLSIDISGGLKITRGLIRPGEKVAPDPDKKRPVVDRPPTPARKAGVTRRAADELEEVRAVIVRRALVKPKGFSVLFDLLAFQLACDALETWAGSRSFALRIDDTRSDLMMKSDEERVAEWSPLERVLITEASHLDYTWYDGIESPAERFRAFCALSLPKRKRWLAASLARGLVSQLSTSPITPALEIGIERLGINWARAARPNLELYWSQCTKPRLLEIGREVLGDQWAEAYRTESKAALAKEIDKAFRTRPEARSWVMPGLEPADLEGEK